MRNGGNANVANGTNLPMIPVQFKYCVFFAPVGLHPPETTFPVVEFAQRVVLMYEFAFGSATQYFREASLKNWHVLLASHMVFMTVNLLDPVQTGPVGPAHGMHG